MVYLRRVLLMGCAIVLVMPATALATPVNNSPPTISSFSSSSSSAPLEVGVQQLMCNPGSWTSTGAGPVSPQSYAWYRDSTSGTQDSTSSYYTPVAADAGHTLVCQVTEYDFSDQTTATATSAPTGIVLPSPSVTITQYSTGVSGNIGENVAGVSVTATLERSGAMTEVAVATTTTDASGNWTATLAPENPPNGPANAFSLGDQLAVHYAPPSGQTTTVPEDTTYASAYSTGASTVVQFVGSQSTIAGDGSTLSGPSVYSTAGPCAGLSFVIDDSAHATTQQPNGTCVFAPSPSLTDQDHVQASSTTSYRDATTGSSSALTAISDVGLLGVNGGYPGGGAPTCTGDLVSGEVVCGPVNNGTFAVSLNGGPQSRSQRASSRAPRATRTAHSYLAYRPVT